MVNYTLKLLRFVRTPLSNSNLSSSTPLVQFVLGTITSVTLKSAATPKRQVPLRNAPLGWHPPKGPTVSDWSVWLGPLGRMHPLPQPAGLAQYDHTLHWSVARHWLQQAWALDTAGWWLPPGPYCLGQSFCAMVWCGTISQHRVCHGGVHGILCSEHIPAVDVQDQRLGLEKAIDWVAGGVGAYQIVLALRLAKALRLATPHRLCV